MPTLKALIFDCDGVLADTERDGHRVAFNKTFAQMGYDFRWDVVLYGRLLKVAGGKERMRAYFEEFGWPAEAVDKNEFIKEMHRLKTDLYMKIIDSGQLPPRSGVKRLVDEAVDQGVVLAVCSTSNQRAVNLVVERLLGPERKDKFSAILAGGVVSQKKPDPEIYNLAKEHLSLNPAECVVVEDSRNGLLAAKEAGMNCIITISGYTGNEDFTEADKVVDELGDPPDVKVNLEDLKQIVANK